MRSDYILLLPVLLPVLAAVPLAFIQFKSRRGIRVYTFLILALEAAACVGLAAAGSGLSLQLISFTQNLVLYLHIDTLSSVFLVLISCVWLLSGLFSFEYLEHEENEKSYYVIYLVVVGVLTGLATSGNLLTFYIFYELMSLTSMPLVLHTGTHESVMAALKYLFYSIAGALMSLFGIFVMSYVSGAGSLEFSAGGILTSEEPSALLLAAVFLTILGFGTKAGLFPMHAWLPTAHPVAPAPASAVLSGVITKMGILGVIRSVYYVAGADLIRGTWVQYTWITLALLTVFMGSMLAYKEKILKKRLAYSSVSQVSYVMFGLSVLTPAAFVGALLHVIFHALAKNTLFLSAGAIIHKTGKTRVDELEGIGKQMPVTMWCFTFASLSLIGIPPLCGFVSKWYLATGALDSGIAVASWLGPVILLVSALLTAGYLLPVIVKGFIPGKEFDYTLLEKKEPGWKMLVPLVILAALSLLLGVFPGGLTDILTDIASGIL